MKTWKAWTSLEERDLRELRADGMTAAEIAQELGRTVCSVRVQLCRLKTRSVRNTLLSRWLPEFQLPHSTTALAAKYGVTVQEVRRAKRELRRRGYECLRAGEC